jgi:MSHA pilin protein MshA
MTTGGFTMELNERILKNQKGFTLIEIIAVLIILGILAAVAVPKFMDMQDDAKQKALEGALAEGMSTMSLSYAKLMLSNNGVASTAQVAGYATANPPASDDFSYTFANGGLVSVVGKGAGALGATSAVTKQWRKP